MLESSQAINLSPVVLARPQSLHFLTPFSSLAEVQNCGHIRPSSVLKDEEAILGPGRHTGRVFLGHGDTEVTRR